MAPRPHANEHGHEWDKEEVHKALPGFDPPSDPHSGVPDGEGRSLLTDLSLVTLEAKLSAIRLFSRSRISSTAPELWAARRERLRSTSTREPDPACQSFVALGTHRYPVCLSLTSGKTASICAEEQAQL